MSLYFPTWPHSPCLSFQIQRQTISDNMVHSSRRWCAEQQAIASMAACAPTKKIIAKSKIAVCWVVKQSIASMTACDA